MDGTTGMDCATSMDNIKGKDSSASGRDLYIIVHENCIRQQVANRWSERMRCRAAEVEQVLEQVKAEKEYLAITGSSRRLHPMMPPPAPGLRVLVAGAYRFQCVKYQHRCLRRKGYDAEILEEGCLE